MQMICEGDNCGCQTFCSHSQPHNHCWGCDTHFACDFRACSLYVSEKPLPLTNIPGVEFAKEECYLVPVADYHKDEVYKCRQCGDIFKTLQGVADHFEIKHTRHK